MSTSNRIPNSYKRNIAKPLTDALIAFHLGHGNEDYYYHLTGALFIASEIVNLVHRHKHLHGTLDESLRSLDSIYDRYQDQGVWSGSKEEIHSLDLGIEIYAALLSSTPTKTVKRAMERVKKSLKQKQQ